MKAVLMSIKPRWCELIASGKKTVEVRKTKPKLDVPFKVYIYCTKGRGDCLWRWNGIWYDTQDPNHRPNRLDGKVIGEFVCDRIEHFKTSIEDDAFLETWKRSCVLLRDLLIYMGGNLEGYGWHITDLVIYDKPRGVGEFIVPSKIGCCNEGKCRGCRYFDRGNGFNIEDDCNAKFSTDEYKPLRRPPQSWCYVEEESDG